MRNAGLLLCCWAAVVGGGCSAQDDASPEAIAPSRVAVVEPRIVVQLGHQAPVLAVRWVDGGRHLASIAGDGSIVFWNVASGAILDHAQVPLDPALFAGEEAPLRFHAISDGAHAGTLAIAYAAASEAVAERRCPGAHRAGTRSCRYVLDLATRAVRADAGAPVPAINADDDGLRWPVSPDGRLRPQPNHADGRRGLFDLADENILFPDPTCVSPARCRYGVTLLDTRGEYEPHALTGVPRNYFLDADLSADGLRLVRVEGLQNETLARVETLDLLRIGAKQAGEHLIQ